MSELSEIAHERVEDARIALETLGMDAERSNERSALVLLVLLHLAPSGSWAEATNPMLGTRAIMDFIRDAYGKDYAPNTRETVRRFTLHQFVEAQLVVQNPDEPQRSVNSPRWTIRSRPRRWTYCVHMVPTIGRRLSITTSSNYQGSRRATRPCARWIASRSRFLTGRPSR